MPTLVLQSISKDWRKDFPLWARYLGSRAAFREGISAEYGIDMAQAKGLLQAMFDLRKFDGSRSGVSDILGVQRCKRAMSDKLLLRAQDEAVLAWAAVDLEKRTDGARRFAYYEQTEQTVMNAIYDAATEHSVRFWPFHDAFTLLDAGCRIKDLEEMSRFVKEKAGYSILLDERLL